MTRLTGLRILARIFRMTSLLIAVAMGVVVCSTLTPGGFLPFRLPSLLEGFLFIGTWFLYALLLYGAGELIELLLTIEANTQAVAELLRRQGPPPAA